jgi:hypothetical protein
MEGNPISPPKSNHESFEKPSFKFTYVVNSSPDRKVVFECDATDLETANLLFLEARGESPDPEFFGHSIVKN